MQFSANVIALISALSTGVSADSFNYRYTNGDEYGPADWRKVSCGNLETCVSSNKKNGSLRFRLSGILDH